MSQVSSLKSQVSSLKYLKEVPVLASLFFFSRTSTILLVPSLEQQGWFGVGRGHVNLTYPPASPFGYHRQYRRLSAAEYNLFTGLKPRSRINLIFDTFLAFSYRLCFVFTVLK
jgi:hypothetical protein